MALRWLQLNFREMFEGMDENESGDLSAAELTSGLRQQGYEVRPDVKILLNASD